MFFYMPGPWKGASGAICHNAQQMPPTARYMHADWVVVEMVEVVVMVEVVMVVVVMEVV